MRAEAFGEIGIKPSEFYRLDIQDYYLWRRGYLNKLIYEQRVFRNIVMRIIAPWVKELPNPYKFFPVMGDDELKELEKEQRLNLSEQAMKVLQMHKQGGFEYVQEGKKIIQKWIDKERDQNAKEN